MFRAWKIRCGKFAEGLACSLVVCARSLFGRIESTKIDFLSKYPDMRLPSAGVKDDPTKPARVVSSQFGISLIASVVAFAKVVAAIIQAVSIAVIDHVRGSIAKLPMQRVFHRLAASVIESALVAMCIPAARQHNRRIVDIDFGPLSLSKRDFYHSKTERLQEFHAVHGEEFYARWGCGCLWKCDFKFWVAREA